jgi:hypothetical protein
MVWRRTIYWEKRKKNVCNTKQKVIRKGRKVEKVERGKKQIRTVGKMKRETKERPKYIFSVLSL